MKSNDAYGNTTKANCRTGATVEAHLRMSHNEAYGTVVNDNEDHEYDYVVV